MRSPLVDSPLRPPRPRAAVRAAWLLALCSALLLALVVARWGPLADADEDIARTTHRRALAEGGVTRAMRILTDWVWDPWTMRLLCALVVLWLWRRREDRWTAGWLAAACVLGSLLQHLFKAAVDRPRPVWSHPVDSAHYAAYPSGHAMTAALVCGLLVWLLRDRGAARVPYLAALTAAVVSVAGVGVTRIWLGVHWPTDVVGGWLLGALVAVLAVLAHQRWRP